MRLFHVLYFQRTAKTCKILLQNYSPYVRLVSYPGYRFCTVALEVARPNTARRAVFAIEQYSNGPILRSSNDPIPLSNNGQFLRPNNGLFLRSNNGQLLGSNNGQLLGSNNGLFLEPNNGLILRSYSGPFLRPNVLWYIYNVHDVIYIL